MGKRAQKETDKKKCIYSILKSLWVFFFASKVPDGGDLSSGEALRSLMTNLTDAIPFKLLYWTEKEIAEWPAESKSKFKNIKSN